MAGSLERRWLTYRIFTIGDRRFTIASRMACIVSPVKPTLRHPTHAKRPAMKTENEIVRIDLTPEQKQLVKKEIGKDAEAVELTARELEERIAPLLPAV
jgi:hypothetical protein